MVYLFTDLPGQIHVKHQGTNAVVTWTPEYNPKCFVVDWGTGKEDMHMKIVATTTGNFTLGNSNYQIYLWRHHFMSWLFLVGVRFSSCFSEQTKDPDNCNTYLCPGNTKADKKQSFQ